ncbi:MAG: aminopeptidase P family protein [Trueperaceae bacterium]|nr:aminopeptidase P family protein [Trueperaceae bacterium]MCW5818590.1 aminopeptidase P family protein [Trueperaceae bacterium]
MRTLRERLRAAGADALLVTNPPNVRYLSAFSAPEDGAVLLTQDAVTLYTDARYTTQAGQEVAIQIEVVPSIDEAVADKLAGRRLAVEGEHMTLGRNRAIARRLGSEPVAVDGFFTALRTVKSEREVAALREAARVTDEAFSAALAMMGPGVREIEVALCLESAMRLAGAEGSAFDIIVASGTRGAMPHGVASQKELAAGELVTLDFGAVVNGYHADMTRTVAVGAVGAEERRLFEAVLEAQEASLAALAPGRTGREIDAVARAALARHGLEEYFTHSLGHGTGLVIHEEPRLSKKSDTVLQPGMIVTVEPGVYLPGFTGLRIEDLAVITSDGHEVLSRSPKGFRSV